MLKRPRDDNDGEEAASAAFKKARPTHAPNDIQEGSGKRKQSHDAYTVGWICVLRCELNAARAMLDEEHERLPQVEKDDNSYILGRMGEHQVAIAFTGSGSYGKSAAAQTAANMVRTFRNIRFGLLVGVGGGAPSRPHHSDPTRDIRLGDVVVGSPKGGHSKNPLC